uniref:HIT domain-containing protein n=1 Tax=Arcella intermedia TaxID=1963864 RepID=A0A6B2LJ78_9EUKA
MGMFKNKGSDFPGVYYQDEHTVTIYDQYPKSIVHLLVLPQKNILNLDSLGPQDVPILLEMKKTKDLIIQHLSGPQEPKSKLNLEYKSGFHAIPSMNHLHLHIISNDFLLVKNAKHYQSFNSSYLVPIEDIILGLEENGRVENYAKMREIKEFDKKDLIAPDGTNFKRAFKKLKDHMAQQFYAIHGDYQIHLPLLLMKTEWKYSI